AGMNAGSTIDRQLPELIGKLRSRQLEEKTVVILTSAGGSPESLGLPLIMCWPGHIPVESRPPELVGTYDFLPMLCELTGATAPDRNLCGRSYYPLVLSRPFPKKERWGSMQYGTFGNTDTASDSRFKLILRDGGKGPNQLFDIRDDPKQITNEFANRNYITTRDDFRRNLLAWKAKYSK
ncbi:MAG TPA: sulfatase/phosphatase domain-containing protein, partial [Bryobacteraceae bacterium]